ALRKYSWSPTARYCAGCASTTSPCKRRKGRRAVRLCWFDDFRLGVVEGDSVADVTAALEVLPQAGYPPRMAGDLLVAHLDQVVPMARSLLGSATRKPLTDVFFRSPVASPTKIIGVPVNYLKHVEEAHEQREEFTTRYAGALEEQGLFLK